MFCYCVTSWRVWRRRDSRYRFRLTEMQVSGLVSHMAKRIMKLLCSDFPVQEHNVRMLPQGRLKKKVLCPSDYVPKEEHDCRTNGSLEAPEKSSNTVITAGHGRNSLKIKSFTLASATEENFLS